MELRKVACAAALLVLLCTPTPAAEPVSVEQALLLTGVAQLLPPGTAAGQVSGATVPILTRALRERVTRNGAPETWLALLVLEPPAPPARPARAVRVLAARTRGPGTTSVLSITQTAPDIHMLDLGTRKPDGGLVLSVQWATGPAPHEGKLDVWSLEGPTPVQLLSDVVEGFYYRDVDGDRATSLVVYRAEPGSLVILPAVLRWKDGALVPSPGRHDLLDRELLASYDALLAGYAEDNPSGDPPRMIVDAALLKGRLLERRGELKDAFRAYARVTRLIPDSLVARKGDSPERKELLLRAAEARRRGAMLARRPIRRRR